MLSVCAYIHVVTTTFMQEDMQEYVGIYICM